MNYVLIRSPLLPPLAHTTGLTPPPNANPLPDIFSGRVVWAKCDGYPWWPAVVFRSWSAWRRWEIPWPTSPTAKEQRRALNNPNCRSISSRGLPNPAPGYMILYFHGPRVWYGVLLNDPSRVRYFAHVPKVDPRSIVSSHSSSSSSSSSGGGGDRRMIAGSATSVRVKGSKKWVSFAISKDFGAPYGVHKGSVTRYDEASRLYNIFYASDGDSETMDHRTMMRHRPRRVVKSETKAIAPRPSPKRPPPKMQSPKKPASKRPPPKKRARGGKKHTAATAPAAAVIKAEHRLAGVSPVVAGVVFTSKFVGVCWDKQKHTWKSSITISGKHLHLGHYTDTREAAIAYDCAARKHRGKRAKCNFKEGTTVADIAPVASSAKHNPASKVKGRGRGKKDDSSPTRPPSPRESHFLLRKRKTSSSDKPARAASSAGGRSSSSATPMVVEEVAAPKSKVVSRGARGKSDGSKARRMSASSSKSAAATPMMSVKEVTAPEDCAACSGKHRAHTCEKSSDAQPSGGGVLGLLGLAVESAAAAMSANIATTQSASSAAAGLLHSNNIDAGALLASSSVGGRAAPIADSSTKSRRLVVGTRVKALFDETDWWPGTVIFVFPDEQAGSLGGGGEAASRGAH